jgi:hypothetical protein
MLDYRRRISPPFSSVILSVELACCRESLRIKHTGTTRSPTIGADPLIVYATDNQGAATARHAIDWTTAGIASISQDGKYGYDDPKNSQNRMHDRTKEGDVDEIVMIRVGREKRLVVREGMEIAMHEKDTYMFRDSKLRRPRGPSLASIGEMNATCCEIILI